jgi:hypothetical protein
MKHRLHGTIAVLVAVCLVVIVATGCGSRTGQATDNGTTIPSGTDDTSMPQVQQLTASMFTESAVERFGWSGGAVEMDGRVYYGVPQVSERGLGVFSRALASFGTVKALYITKKPVSAVISQEQGQSSGTGNAAGTPSQPDVTTSLSDTELPDESIITVIGAGGGWVTSLEYVRSYVGNEQQTKTWKLVSHNVASGRVRTLATDAGSNGPAYVPHATQDGTQVLYDLTDKAAFNGPRHSRLVLVDLAAGTTRTVVDSSDKQYWLPTLQGERILTGVTPMEGATTATSRLVILDLKGAETAQVTTGVLMGTLSGNTVVWLAITDQSKTSVQMYDLQTRTTRTLYKGGTVGEFAVNDRTVAFTDASDSAGFMYERSSGKLYRLNPTGSDIMNVFLLPTQVLFEIKRDTGTGDSTFTMGVAPLSVPAGS